jgi:hypothetical protein
MLLTDDAKNPYCVEGPLNPNDPGRNAEIWERLYVQRPGLETAIVASVMTQHYYIHAPHDMGKTSLLLYLRNELKALTYEVLYAKLDPFRQRSSESWFRSLCAQFEEALELEQPLKIMSSHQDLQRYLNELVMRRSGTRGVIVLLDGLDKMVPIDKGEQAALDFMAAISTIIDKPSGTLRKVRFVTTGNLSHETIQRRLPPARLYNSDPLRNMKLIRLDEWDTRGTVQLAQLLTPKHRIDDMAIAQIHQWASGHPYLTQLILWKLYDISDEHLNARDVDSVAKAIVHEHREERHLRQLFGGAFQSLPTQEQKYLLEIRGAGMRWSESDITLIHLRDRGYVRDVKDDHGEKQAVIRNQIYLKCCGEDIPPPIHRTPIEIAKIESPHPVLQLFIMLAIPGLIILLLDLPAAASGRQHLLNIISQRLPLLATMPLEWLLKVGIFAVGLVCLYLLIWALLRTRYHRWELIALRSIDSDAPPVSLGFWHTSRPGQEWECRVGLTDSFAHEVKAKAIDLPYIELPPERRHQVNQDNGTLISARLHRPACWRCLVLPWPQRWLVEIELEYQRVLQLCRIHVAVDANESLVRVLAWPVTALLQSIRAILEGRLGGGK